MRTRSLGRRGSILLHVMVTGAVVAFIAATLMRMTLLRQQAAARGAVVLQEKRDDTALLAQILSAWNGAGTPPGSGQTCANVAIPGYTFAGSGGTCGCSYTPSAQTNPPTLPSVTTALVGGSCQLTIVSATRQ